MTGVEETFLAEEEMERVPTECAAIGDHGAVLKGETLPQLKRDLPQTEVAPSTISEDQGEKANPKDVQPRSPVIMMPSIGAWEQSLTIGLILSRLIIVEIPPSPASSPPSDEVDYSGDDIDFGDEPPPPDTSKFFHLAAEDMVIISPGEVVLPPVGITST